MRKLDIPTIAKEIVVNEYLQGADFWLKYYTEATTTLINKNTDDEHFFRPLMRLDRNLAKRNLEIPLIEVVAMEGAVTSFHGYVLDLYFEEFENVYRSAWYEPYELETILYRRELDVARDD